ncbi:unnamed protein product [Rhodiola kirilowii]
MEIDEGQTGDDSSFREELMNILLKPYDQVEYESLMEEASKRRPLERYGELRWGRTRTSELQVLGKSYLDYHKDLAKAIEESSGDPQKVLTLLRGFIFWLQNLTRDGAFQPWKDKQSLEVLGMSNAFRTLII